MDVLLIQPSFVRKRQFENKRRSLVPPMMLHYLAKPLIEEGLNVDVLDLSTYAISDTRLKEYIRYWNPRIVGITSVTESFFSARGVAKLIRSTNPKTLIVIGGPHVSFKADETLQYDCFDFVVRGEGDLAFADLVKCLLNNDGQGLSKIPGISYKENGRIINHDRVLIKDLDKLGFPIRNKVNPERYVYSAVIMTSRGCPFRCHFCSATAMAGGRYRMRNIDSILEELDYLTVSLQNRRFSFSDDTITAHPARLERICAHILNRNYATEWVCASRVDVVNNKLLQLMARAGCRSIQFGFESGNEDVLRSINKKITPEQILFATKLCVQHGIIPYGNFIIGFPEDTSSTIQDTYNLALAIKKMNGTCDFAIMTPFPGTYFYHHAEELGVKIHTENWSEYLLDNPVISTKHLDIDELKALYIKCRTGLSRMENWN
jgi:radical SAM superfamily enzyme YgiQ (UPF0313 family)